MPVADARLEELVRRHGLDAGARAYLEELRWPDGVSCVRCSSRRVGSEHRIRAAMAQALGRTERARPVALATSRSLRRPPAPAEAARAVAASPAIVRGVRLLRQTAGPAYRRPSLEHLGAYWAELRWRAAHAGTEDVFRMTMQALLEADPVTYRQLIRHSRPTGPA